MFCPNCGEENADNVKFCKSCGKPLENNSKHNEVPKTNNKNKLIIIALAVIAIVLAIGVIYAGGFLKGDIPLETKDFEVFKMDVPKGANFVETNSIPNYGFGGLVCLQNGGEYSREVGSLMVSTIAGSSHPSEVSLDRTEGDIKVFKDNQGNDAYYIVREIDDYEFVLIGNDDKTMIKMLNSIKITDEDKLASESSHESNSSSTSDSKPVKTSSSSSTSKSISILGGSFSTGSADADKTYARINVGKEHAGEDVVVQIWYSRDGNTLNNGNMVPASVHSDGYLEIASADAYKYYPDYATINIYDSGNNLLDTQSVSLSPSAGTQTF